MAMASLFKVNPLDWKQSFFFPVQSPPPLRTHMSPIASLLKVSPLDLSQSFLPFQSSPPPPNIRRHGRSNLAVSFMNKAAGKFNCCCYATTTTTTTTAKCFTMKQQKHEYSKEETSANTLDVVADAMFHVLRKTAITAVMLGALLMYDPYRSALAASGGRMGGNSFSSRSSRSGSSSSSSRSYSSSSSQLRSSSSSKPTRSSMSSKHRQAMLLGLYLFVAFILVCAYFSFLEKTSRSVIKLQVAGLLALGQAVQNDLNKIAEVAETSTPEGLNYVLTETILALLRHPDYCILSCSSVDIKWSMEVCEARFHQLSMEERGKVDEETLVNVNNIKRLSTTSQRESGFNNEYLVLTILVAAKGVYKLPTINGSGDLKEALQKLGSILSSKTLAVEVLWTPQNGNDTLSKQKLQEDYPLLRPLEQHSTA